MKYSIRFIFIIRFQLWTVTHAFRDGGINRATRWAVQNPRAPCPFDEPKSLKAQTFATSKIQVLEEALPVRVRNTSNDRMDSSVGICLSVLHESHNISVVHRHVELCTSWS